jgi:hypothetical protein
LPFRGLIIAGGHAVSLGLIIWEAMLSYYDSMAGVPGGIGLGLMGLTAAYGFVRPYLLQRWGAHAGIGDRLDIALVPVDQDRAALRLSYTVRF